MNETYIKFPGKWRYPYRAIDREGQTLDLILFESRDIAAARWSFKPAVSTNVISGHIVIDESAANTQVNQVFSVIEAPTIKMFLFGLIQSHFRRSKTSAETLNCTFFIKRLNFLRYRLSVSVYAIRIARSENGLVSYLSWKTGARPVLACPEGEVLGEAQKTVH
ncbi:MAG: DDE-type integrase/transposase/recombinase [Roseobacter sp.]